MPPEPEFFPLTLGERTWNLPHFTFGVIKWLQPLVLAANAPLTKVGVAQVDAPMFDALLDATHAALALVDPGVVRAEMETWRFSSNDLISAQTAILRALGMVRDEARDGGVADPKAPSTTSSPA